MYFQLYHTYWLSRQENIFKTIKENQAEEESLKLSLKKMSGLSRDSPAPTLLITVLQGSELSPFPDCPPLKPQHFLSLFSSLCSIPPLPPHLRRLPCLGHTNVSLPSPVFCPLAVVLVLIHQAATTDSLSVFLKTRSWSRRVWSLFALLF